MISIIDRKTIIFILGAIIIVILLEILIRYIISKFREKKEVKKHDDLYTDGSKVLYSDSDEAYLMTFRYKNIMLQGKPDFVLQDQKGTVYVKDLKSGRSPGFIKREFRMQLAAYFLLVEKDLKKGVSYGVIHYQEDRKNVKIENTEELIRELYSKLDTIALAKENIDNYLAIAKRNHNEEKACKFCEYNNICKESLVMNNLNTPSRQ